MITGVHKEMNLPFGFEPNGDWLSVKAVLEKPVKPELLLKTMGVTCADGSAQGFGQGTLFCPKMFLTSVFTSE